MAAIHFDSLRWRLLLLVGLAILPLVALTVTTGIRERQHAMSGAEANLLRLTRLAAANEAQSLEGARQILRDLTSVPAIIGPPDGCDELLASIMAKNDDFVNFGLIDLHGNVICSAVPRNATVNLADRSHFQRAIAERRFIAGNYVFGRVVRKHTVNLTYPVMHGNTVSGVLFAAIDLSNLDRFVADIKLPAGSLLWTLDGEGTVISRRPALADWVGRKMTGAAALLAATRTAPAMLTDADGVERLYASAPVGKNGLSEYSVLIGVPRDAILADAIHGQWLAMIGLSITVLMAALAAWFGGNVLVLRRLRMLAETADLIASGSLSTRTGISYGKEEISQLARSLDEMAQALEAKERERDAAQARLVAADQRKDEFLAMLAHELRNPLAPISAGAQLLQRAQAQDPTVARTAAIIVRQVAHMTRLVDDLLDVSRVTRGLVKLEREQVDLRTVVADAIEQIAPLAARKQQRLEAQLPDDVCLVDGDRKRLVQICGNVINNAAKYTPEGGRIVVALTVEAAKVRLTVSDNGIGMPPELVDRVFELFAQGQRDSDRSQGGLGLGLALVKTLVLLHGGTVCAQSSGPGLGSRFIIELARCDRQAQPVLEAASGQYALAVTGMRCLVVDDNVDAAATLAMFLEAGGHTAVIAHTGSEALVLAAATAPQVCLLDIGLPDINGNTLVARLKGVAGVHDALFIAVTGYGRKEDREHSLAAGFHQYFVKPLDTASLAAVLAAKLNHSRQ
jgi:signal transduction histidine kinase/ActR/RegA family two-component response regulator